MSEQEQPLLIMECYPDSQDVIIPDEDTPIFTIQTTEPFVPSSTFFQRGDTKYLVKKCYPYQDADNKEHWLAIVQECEQMGVGPNDPNFNADSKIFGEKAAAFQKKRDELKLRHVDPDILEEMGVDIMALTEEAIQEMEDASGYVSPDEKIQTLEQEKQILQDDVATMKAKLDKLQIDFDKSQTPP